MIGGFDYVIPDPRDYTVREWVAFVRTLWPAAVVSCEFEDDGMLVSFAYRTGKDRETIDQLGVIESMEEALICLYDDRDVDRGGDAREVTLVGKNLAHASMFAGFFKKG